MSEIPLYDPSRSSSMFSYTRFPLVARQRLARRARSQLPVFEILSFLIFPRHRQTPGSFFGKIRRKALLPFGSRPKTSRIQPSGADGLRRAATAWSSSGACEGCHAVTRPMGELLACYGNPDFACPFWSTKRWMAKGVFITERCGMSPPLWNTARHRRRCRASGCFSQKNILGPCTVRMSC